MSVASQISYLIFALRNDRPDEYLYVRNAYELRRHLEDNSSMFRDLGIEKEEIERFWRNALYAQATAILRTIAFGEVWVHPILVDPVKLVRMLEVLEIDADVLRRIEPDIYRLARGIARLREPGETLNGLEARGLVDRMSCARPNQLWRDFRIVAELLGVLSSMLVNEFLERVRGQRATANIRLLNLRGS
ncbi:MAG: hypothetical protein UX09_C0019G0021 [Candidatus Uhrbacteria bacterium GW2011_GWE2_45_35]|uniref:Uncharacterized protein n=2 Tax=Candidatus Uhriibacteriota TaxID=1752732 RepID=A0A0G1JJ48_9BACT|nr:MAG: hypothetical protein UW63_C0018G0020 [Candidatus Uhrbacteria bacterium GW2011_GWF2_44_350]KKU08322.1 MAG: hypothetical protein UX09_C0019G0021 [Candidatus Uhrbacteria bacterium GW2011_GWE2_45_35]HBR81017.1 hypothetical protein [Candidatus Uhrbacteria bacterium]HCU31827.1 hypothetical protein [Candidatus Uhrbacteria bacterium]